MTKTAVITQISYDSELVAAATSGGRDRHNAAMVPPEVRAALDALRRQTLERVQDLERDRSRIVDASRSSNADDEHDPEGQTIAWDREQTAALLRDARARLAEIDVASARLDGGWDGSCEVCGEPVPPGRLVARPTTARCVRCA